MQSLKDKRRKYIFQGPQQFSEVERGEVRGADLLLSEVDPIIERIKNFTKLAELGIDIGGGALFFGPKGAGKTYFAQYLATATKDCARFVNIRRFPKPKERSRESALAAEDIRELFRLSQEYVKDRNQPVILCYDEFEEMDEETLEELRIQLSGLKKRFNGIYFLFISTSAPDDLDERLFRPGRISDIVQFTELTVRGQCEVLRFAISRHPHDPSIDFESIVYLSREINTPAAIVDIANAAYLAAVGEKKSGAKIKQRHVISQYLRRITGQPAEETLDEKDLWITAIHEAGHTVLARILGMRLRFTSILPQLRSPEHHGQTNVEIPSKIAGTELFLDFLAFRFGGLIGERLFGCHDFLTLEDDIRDITSAIQVLVEKLGNGQELRRQHGYLALPRPLNEYSDGLRRIVERDMGHMAKQAFHRAWKAVRNADQAKVKTMIEKIARELLRKRILIRNEIEEILSK